jgi:phosphoribosyl 1,2-cyclic phosphate phosphodiesterase
MRVTILGCGGSGGVPLADGTPGGHWGACDSENPKNRRRRVSLLVEEGGFSVLIDASPDLREQLIDSGATRIDALLFTHAHADHCHGLDELRAFRWRQGAAIPAYMDALTQRQLTRRFGYAFTSSARAKSLYKPLLDDRVIDGPFTLGPWEIRPFVQNHGPEDSLGFRIGDFAYSTDVKALDAAARGALTGLRLWILDCLRDEPHPTHSHTTQSLEWIAQLKPARAVLTHLNHQIDYADLAARCPPGVEPGYDGLVIEL